jgi:hypothetical protein
MQNSKDFEHLLTLEVAGATASAICGPIAVEMASGRQHLNQIFIFLRDKSEEVRHAVQRRWK